MPLEVPEFKDLEQAREFILTAKETYDTLEKDKITLEDQIKDYSQRIQELQEHNQKLFLRVTQPEEKTDPPKERKSLEEFAKTLNI